MYNWCHGPNCHTQTTLSRVRGSKGNKVLRTIKVKVYEPETPHIYDFFSNQQCLPEYLRLHVQSITAIAPRREALETPIKDPVKTTYDNGYYPYTRTEIKEVDNNSNP